MSHAAVTSQARYEACDPELAWMQWSEQIWSAPIDPDRVRSRLILLAGSLRPLLIESSDLTAEWAPLGVRVIPTTMHARGHCIPSDRSRTIAVNQADGNALQRFTVAHEICHLLLTPQARARPLLFKAREEETICDEFAAEMLIPQASLIDSLPSGGLPPTTDEILRLCGRFRVNVRPMLFAIARHLAHEPYHLVLAR
jgi:IrrE N-terminal-like domain